MKTITPPPNYQLAVGNLSTFLKFLGKFVVITFTMVFFSTNIHAQGLWQANNSSVVFTFRDVGVKTDSPTNDFHVNGSFRSRSAYVDSFLTALEAQTGALTTGSLLVTGNSQFNGLLNIGSHLLIDGTGGLITSSSGFLGFGNNNLTTTGNISADSLFANHFHSFSGNVETLHVTSLHSNTIHSTSINSTTLQSDTGRFTWLNANNLLQNGNPLVSSQWTSAGSNIYFQGGNVGIGTTVPSFPFEVHGNAAITGTVFADRIEAQSHIGIGQFRFINGAAQPGQADTIRTPAALQVQATGTMQLTTAEALKMQAAGTVAITSVSDTIKLAAGTVTVGGPAPTPSPSLVALDVVGDVRVSGIISASGFSSNSDNILYTAGTPWGTQERTRIKGNTGYVGIGTDSPQELLHLDQPSPTSSSTPFNVYAYFTNNHTATIGTGQGSRIGISEVGDLEIRQHHAGSPIRFWTTEFNTSILKERMTITDIGRVGIGTDNPFRKLQIESASTASPVDIGLYQAGAEKGIFAVAGAANQFFTGTVSGDVAVRSLSQKLFLGSGVGNPNMVLINNGNVGIGTTNPGSLLNISKSIPTAFGSPYLLVGRREFSATGIQTIGFGYTDGSPYTIAPAEIGFAMTSTAGGTLGDLVFATRNVTTNTAPSERVRITNAGNVGIGTTNPQTMLHLFSANIANCPVGLRLQYQLTGPPVDGCSISSTWDIKNSGSGTLDFSTPLLPNPIMTMSTTGNVSIGNDKIISGVNADYKLSVDGKVVARKLVSTEVDWGDDEFDKKLILDDLEEEERYVYEQGHLSGVPSGEEVRQDGIDHADMSERKIRKIEQIFMYLFDFNRIIKDLKKENKDLKHENLQFRNELSDLKKRIEALEEKGK